MDSRVLLRNNILPFRVDLSTIQISSSPKFGLESKPEFTAWKLILAVQPGINYSVERNTRSIEMFCRKKDPPVFLFFFFFNLTKKVLQANSKMQPLSVSLVFGVQHFWFLAFTQSCSQQCYSVLDRSTAGGFWLSLRLSSPCSLSGLLWALGFESLRVHPT